MRYLLDTHTFLWYITGDPRLGQGAEKAITDPAHEIVLSIATPWEIAVKVGIGKLILGEQYGTYITREIARNRLVILSITLDHLDRVASLPHHHRDPFDRLIIAQAMVEGIPVLSTDAVFDAYGVARLW
jgi:PIN domain nuclease of toxin-antitoxin system